MNILLFFQYSNSVLGLNTRDLDYLRVYNPPPRLLRLSDKLSRKAIFKEAGLCVPQTLLPISKKREILSIPWDTLPSGFVIKPASSSQGKGVLVVFGRSKRRKNTWIAASGRYVSKGEIEYHLSRILEGEFSPYPDKAFFEERIRVHPSLKSYARRGTPDIRVIVFNKVPVMAELRLPTLRSEGRSNLHMGGIGVGVDLASGITTHAIYLGKQTRFLPTSRMLLTGIKIPAWDKVLLIAVEAQKAIGWGFCGVDIGVDRESEPVIFEINPRPGLAIQNANLSGLREHLERIKGLDIKSARQGVAIAQALFGGDVQKQLEIISGKKVVGIFEPISIETPKGLWTITAKLDTGAYSSSIDRTLLKKLGIKNTAIYKKKVKSALGEEMREFVGLTFILKGERTVTEASVSRRKEPRYDVLIGRKDLKIFLLDPAMRKPKVV